ACRFCRPPRNGWAASFPRRDSAAHVRLRGATQAYRSRADTVSVVRPAGVPAARRPGSATLALQALEPTVSAMVDPLPFATYSFVMSITPGPNNVMLTASGATFGFRRTIPHILGISVGFGAELLAVCAGLGAIFNHWPYLQTVLRWVGAAYLIYLGIKMLGGSGAANSRSSSRPVTFFEAALFQFLNPKAWVMTIT